MKFSIKQAGVMFAVLAIVVLAVSGVLLGINFGNSAKVDVNASGNVEPVVEQTPDVILISDSEGTVAEKWSKAVKLSIENKKEIFVQLGHDWNADLIADGSSFGTDSRSFFQDSILVPKNCRIKLDLNGYKIDRRLKIKKAYGHVIFVEGIFTLMDNKYDSETIFDLYNNSVNGEFDFKTLNIGRITGGNSDNGGGITTATTGGMVVIESGMICENFAGNAAGIMVTNNGKLLFKNGIVCDNKAVVSGGGIYKEGEGDFEFQNGLIYNNSVVNTHATLGGQGGGIFTIGEARISGGIIAKNQAYSHNNNGVGGGMQTAGGDVTISNCKFEYNKSEGVGGAIAVMGGALEGITNITEVEFYNNVTLHNRVGTEGYGGAVYLSSTPTSFCNLNDVKIKNNFAEGWGGGIDTNGNGVSFGGNVEVCDNYLLDGSRNNFGINGGRTFLINKKLENCKIGINYSYASQFTVGYSQYNGNTDPKNYFFSDVEGDVISLNSNGELQMAKTIKSSVYDFVYLENNIRKNYKDNSLIHGNNDFDLLPKLNNNMLILGKIAPNTSVEQFIANLQVGSAKLVLTDNKGNIVYGGEKDNLNVILGTGWNLKVYTFDKKALIDDIYISVLGDVTGDGKVNSLDVNYLRRMINNNLLYTNLNNKPYIQLAALIVNKNGLVNTDGDILWQVVCGKMEIENFF